MKKLLILTAVLGLCTANIQADGLIAFFNNAASLVVTNNGLNNGFAPIGTKVELFYQPGGNSAPAPIISPLDGLVNLGAWEPTTGGGGNPFTLSSQNGRFNGGTLSTGSDVAAGGNAWFTVVGWDGGAASLQQAFLSGADIGESTVFELTTGGGGTPPMVPVALTESTPGSEFVAGTPFDGIILGTPEPSVIAIGSLGAAALLLFRRNTHTNRV